MVPGFEEKRKVLSDAIRSLFGHWDIAEGMYTLVTSPSVTEDVLDGLLEIVCVSIKNVETIEGQRQMLNMRSLLEQYKDEEKRQKAAEAEKAKNEISWLF